MLTEIQTIILTCLLGPEDTGAFKRESNRLAVGRYREKHQDRVKSSNSKSNAKRYLANPEKVKTASKLWGENNYPRLRVRMNGYVKARRKTDVRFRMECSLRARIWQAVFKKTGSSIALIGCSVEQLMAHLKSLFKPGMTWENYGHKGWHIDHIKPCAKFDLTDPEEQKACFHWTNLQPLFAVENLRKGDKYVG